MWPHINVSVDNNNYLQFSEVVPPSLPPSPPSSLLPYNSYYLGIAVILMFPYFKFDQSIRHSTGHNPQSTPHNTHTQQ